MYFTQEEHEGCTVVRFDEKRLDVLIAQEIKAELLKVLADGVRILGLDFSNVRFVDSSGLGTLVAVLKNIGPNGKLCLWGLSLEVKALFELTQLYKVFDIYESEKDAISNL